MADDGETVRLVLYDGAERLGEADLNPAGMVALAAELTTAARLRITSNR